MQRRQAILAAVGGGLAAFGAPTDLAAQAAGGRWTRYRSPRFDLYTDVSARAAGEALGQLEAFHNLVVMLTRLENQSEVRNRLPVYLLRRREDLDIAFGRPSGDVAGFYQASSEATAAVCLGGSGGLDRKEILFHEYAHHVMHSGFAGYYPRWFSEGFAEYLATAEFDAREISWGQASANRAAWLSTPRWMNFESVLTGQFKLNSTEAAMFYAQSWLLVHWIFADPRRTAANAAYINGLRAGDDPVASFETRFGLPVKDLEKTLERYGRRFYYQRLSLTNRRDWSVEAEAVRLPAAADDLLLRDLRVRLGVRQSNTKLHADIREAAAKHPGDPYAERVLALADVWFGSPEAALARLEPLRTTAANDVEVHYTIGIAELQLSAAEEDFEAVRARLMRARRAFAAAYQIEPSHVPSLYGLAMTYAGLPGKPHPNALTALGNANALAPEVELIAFAYASALSANEQFEEAAGLFEQIASNPHGGAIAEAAQAARERARRGEPEIFRFMISSPAPEEDGGEEGEEQPS